MWGRKHGAQDDPSAMERGATALVEKLVAAGIDGVGRLSPAREVAENELRRHGEREAAIDAVVRKHIRLAAAGGFVTGVGGLLTLPVALPANVTGYYLVSTRMAAAVAHLRGYDVSRPEVRTAVLLVLVGADADQILLKAGVPVGGLPGMKGRGRIASLALQRLPGPALMVINKGIGFHLLSQVGAKGLARLGRMVPLAGGVVGGGMDAILIRTVARHARQEFVHRAIEGASPRRP